MADRRLDAAAEGSRPVWPMPASVKRTSEPMSALVAG